MSRTFPYFIVLFLIFFACKGEEDNDSCIFNINRPIITYIGNSITPQIYSDCDNEDASYELQLSSRNDEIAACNSGQINGVSTGTTILDFTFIFDDEQYTDTASVFVTSKEIDRVDFVRDRLYVGENDSSFYNFYILSEDDDTLSTPSLPIELVYNDSHLNCTFSYEDNNYLLHLYGVTPGNTIFYIQVSDLSERVDIEVVAIPDPPF